MTSRSVQERIADVLDKLESEVNAWVASASATGDTWLIPLSFYWNGTHFVLATLTNSRTAHNLRRAGVARLALGKPNDAVIIEGDVTAIACDVIEPALADAHAQRAGFDARMQRDGYVYLLVRPQTIQAWRGPSELADRVVMHGGQWLAPRGHG